MTRLATPVTSLPATRVLGRFARALVSLVKAFRDRREVRNLAEFDERMLKDIGLTRSDVDSALMEPLHHRPSWVLVQCVESAASGHGSAAARKPRPVVPLMTRS